jgi:hypothetical protein
MRLTLEAPFSGLRLNAPPTVIGDKEATIAKNIRLSRGTLRCRGGLDLLWEEGRRCDAILSYQNAADVIRTLLVCNGDLVEITGGTRVVRAGGAFAAFRPVDYAVVFDRLYLCDGSAFKVSDGTNVYSPDLAGPATAPTVTLAAEAGPIVGEVDYQYTYYSSTWGQESPPSPTSAKVTATASLQPDLDDWDLPSDPRVDKIRIYRRRPDFRQTVWHLAAEIDVPATTGTVVEDRKGDADLSQRFLSPPPRSPFPFDPSMLTFQGGAMFLNSKTRRTELFFTRPGEPWLVVGSITLEGTEEDSEPITGLYGTQGYLIVGKSNSTWVISGNTIETFQKARISGEIGCVAPHSYLEPADGSVCWMAQSGFYSWNGGAPVLLSAAIEKKFSERNAALDDRVVGLYCKEERSSWWTFAPAGATEATEVLVYWHELGTWTSFEFPSAVSWLGYLTDETTQARKIAVSLANGKIGTYEPSAVRDFDNRIFAEWRSKVFDFGLPDYLKELGRFQADVEYSDSPDDWVSIETLGERDYGQLLVSSMGSRRSPLIANVGRILRRVSFAVQFSGGDCEVSSIIVDVETGVRA